MRYLIVLCLSLAMSIVASAAEFKIVANNATQISSLSRDELKAIFMKRNPRWKDGMDIAPVDQAASSPTRASFTQAIHGKPVAAIESFWQQQIFSGRQVPPITKASDDEVLAFVKANPGAIGYVSSAAPTGGVRVIAVAQ